MQDDAGENTLMLKPSVPLRSCLGWSSHMATGVCGSVLNKP